MFPTSYSKISNTFSIIGFIAESTLKLANHTWCKNLGNMVLEVKIITDFILTFEDNL